VAAPLDPDAVARVLARARELGDSAGPDESVGVSPEALVDAAREVGIDADAVRRALAVEQLPAVPPPRRLDRLAGPGAVIVERVVPVGPADALDRVEAWLAGSHRWRCDRRPDRLHARRPPGAAAALGRLAGSVRAGRRLAGVVSLRVDAVDAGAEEGREHTLVRITADRLPARQRRVGAGAAVGFGGAGAGALVASEALVLVPVVAVPLVAGGYLLARTGRTHADHVELELGRLLSAVERGDRPGGIVADVVGRARAVVSRPPSVPGRRR
jgi:hypothetical protein